MKKTIYLVISLLWIGLNSTFAQIVSPGIEYPGTTDQVNASSPYFGQTDPGTTPVRFTPSKIPSGAWGISFSPDGLECFITQNINNMNTLFTSKETNGSWPNLVVAPFSGIYMDMESTITPDGKRMYFGSMRPLEGVTPGFLYQWYVDKTDSGWSEPKPMDPPLFGKFMMYPSVASNKNMYFTATDGVSNQWIAVSRFADGAYMEPVPLDDSVNSTPFPAHPFIALDESYIIFDAVTDTTNWARDLYICYRKPDSTWSRAINLGTMINDATYSMFPFVSRDGKYFFFYKDQYMMWMDAAFIGQMRPRYGAYLGETPPDTVPKMFAKDFITPNSSHAYSCTFSPDGGVFYYSRLTTSGNNIWKTERINNLWTKPAKAPFPQSTWTIEPNFSPDGNSLFFVSNMPDIPPGPPYYPVLRIWTMDKTDSGWTSPRVLQGPFSDSLKMFPSVAENRNLYFTETNNNCGLIYKSEWTSGGGYQQPVKLDSSINRFVSQAHPFIAPDESYLIFDASPEGPPQWKTYIYISFRDQDGTWKKAQKLSGTINATGGEYCGYISPDKKYMFFGRNNQTTGGTNLWWVKTDNILPQMGIDDPRGDLSKPELFQSYPNPFTENSFISFRLKEPAEVTLELFDITGKRISMLINQQTYPGGKHEIKINAGILGLKPGVYLVQLFTKKAHITTRLIFIGNKNDKLGSQPKSSGVFCRLIYFYSPQTAGN